MAVFDRHNFGDLRGQTVVFSGALVAAVGDVEQLITGFDTGEMPVGSIILSVAKATDQAGLSVHPTRKVTVAGSCPVKYVNPTAAGITPTVSDSYEVIWIKNSE